MIFVDRATVAVPPSLIAAMTSANGELALARAHYPPPPDKPKKPYKFTAYKGHDVKIAIETLFKNKCAYCETHHGASGPVDIEHFRPKAAVLDDKAHQGYWWLAMDWNNLLYSCIDCNRMRGQVIVTPGMTHEEAEKERQKVRRTNAGKKDAFPVRGARLQPEQITFATEDATLINPTEVDPVNHVTFAPDAYGRCLAVATGTAAAPDILGQTSINVFGLNRSALVDARSMLWKKLRVQSEFIKEDLDDYAEATTSQAKAKALDRARRRWLEIESWAQPDQAYSSMVSIFLAQLKVDLNW
ncbi:HNH endonuclease [Altererythrobacter sp. Root672]|uniref:HNH endonuclease n=1 Tax=Altererythrobacter sp. Root672 TaxID=1736584 RepID=UPI0006F54940|nr:HNH endonuclease [Altererythrobacter sp. Root672]KRA79697.1 hypothetical protein ASD76_16870 [Altererythrobacter sp. Root672]